MITVATKLEPTSVRHLLSNCLSDADDAKVVEGITREFHFDPSKLKGSSDAIGELLNQLPETFRESGGGGWSFLMACHDKDGNHWGEHIHIEELVCLGIGVDRVQFVLPREVWSALPGGMPYFVIKDLNFP